MFKHRLKKFVYEHGFKKTKIIHTDSFLGSGVLDKHGQEIFEGDFVKLFGDTFAVTFHNGAFWIGKTLLADYTNGELEIVGHN